MLPIIRSHEQLREGLDERGSLISMETEEIDHILAHVRKMGDRGVKDLSKKYDKVSVSELRVTETQLKKAKGALDASLGSAITLAAENVRRFHEQQVPNEVHLTQPDGTEVALAWRSVSRAGIYVPGGRFPLLSTVIMNVVPAQVAGVKEIAVCSPPGPDGIPNATVLATCAILEIEEVYAMGGAQAIAAFAYGTESVPPVDKITGPGNVYVSGAKQIVSSVVGIDMVAGPTELAVVADRNANPDYVAADLISQAEHDPDAWPFLLTDSMRLMKEVQKALPGFLRDLPSSSTAENSLKDHGFTYLGKTIDDCIAAVNMIAPEHLSLHVSNPKQWVNKVTAGAIFLGPLTPVAWGDYWAGANHILPTLGQARFRGPLSVLDFLVPYTVVEAHGHTINLSGDKVQRLAETEGLEGHALSVQLRRSHA